MDGEVSVGVLIMRDGESIWSDVEMEWTEK